MAYDQYCMKFYHRNVAKRGPEARMYSACASIRSASAGVRMRSLRDTDHVSFCAVGGGLCVPVGAFIFCFTAYPQCHWIGSCIGVVILCTFSP